jgi:hypothetical protein
VTTTEEAAVEPAVALKRCFSGSGKYARRKWAPGGDATYLSRLRKAHLANEMLPDPWYIQEHGGIESKDVPEEGWPQLSAMDIAQRLDQERGGGVESHWVSTLENAATKASARAEARAGREETQRRTREERAAARERQAARFKKGSRVTLGIEAHERDGQEAEVIRPISPTQLLIRFEDGVEELVTDNDVTAVDAPAEEAPTDDGGEFSED